MSEQCQEHNSYYPFVWCVWGFNFTIWLVTFRFEFIIFVILLFLNVLCIINDFVILFFLICFHIRHIQDRLNISYINNLNILISFVVVDDVHLILHKYSPDTTGDKIEQTWQLPTVYYSLTSKLTTSYCMSYGL